MDGLIRLKPAALLVGGWLVGIACAIGRFLFRHVFVYLYRITLHLRRMVRRVIGPARGRAIAVLANRYAVHAAVIALALAVSATSVKAREIQTVDTGDKTLLFSVLSNGATDYNSTVEDTMPAIYRPAGYNYLGDGALRLSTSYDYESEAFTPTTFETLSSGAVLAPTAPGIGTGMGTGATTAARDKTVEYTVQDGDTIGSIAADYNISVSTILWANDLGVRDYLQIGQKLKIPPMDGVLYTVKSGDTVAKIASVYGSDVDKILAANKLSDAGELKVGDEIILPDGEPPAPAVPKATAIPRPIAPLKSIFVPPSASPNASTRFLWPTTGHVITQYFGVWECVSGCRVHTGLDIDGDYSSPIYAADDGVVIFSGWRTGYGYSIDIDHGGGVVTRYGHSSKLFVKVGDRVTRGQTIAMVGSTGYSTGTHLHFEVRIGNVAKNPIGYLR